MSWKHSFSIVHLSDLHLYLDPDLRSEDPTVREAARKRLKKSVSRVKRAGKLVGLDNLEIHSGTALTALEESLATITEDAAQSEKTLIVVHTGDVETVGPRVLPDGAVSFDGYNYLHARMRTQIMGGVPWVDVFGNHDVWGGTWPLYERLAGGDNHTENFQNITDVSGLESYVEPLPLSGDHEVGMLIRRVNTIDPDFIWATLAWGRVGSHPVGLDINQACKDLENCWSGVEDLLYVRVVAMHHPPHAFADGWWATRWLKRKAGPAHLTGATEFAQAVNGKVHLVLAGHRHKIDPPTSATAPFDQRPLRRGTTVQLVAPSPTASKDLSHLDPDSEDDQRSALEMVRSRMYPVYTVEAEDLNPHEIQIWRVFHLLDRETQGELGAGELGERAFRSLPRQLVQKISLQ